MPSWPDPAPRAEQRMEHRVSPVQILLGELLVLSGDDLAARADAELAANPALELDTPITCAGCGRPVWRSPCQACAVAGGAGRERAPVAAAPDGRQWLLTECGTALDAAERVVAAHLLDDVDCFGVLAEPLPVIAGRLDVGERCLERVVSVLRSVSPGVCAGSLAQRLHLAVEALAREVDVPAAVWRLLADPTRCDAGAQAWMRTHVTAELFPVLAEERPRPVDVVVTEHHGLITVAVWAGPWSALRVAESYLAARADPLLGQDVLQAQRFLAALGRREQMLHRVADAVLQHQRDRVLHGPAAHRPLTRHAVATQLGLHASTVGRVLSAKHALLPTGETVRLDSMFGAAQAAKECLRELTAGSVRWSDSRLQRALADHGYALSRRAVAKYRAELGIPSSRVR